MRGQLSGRPPGRGVGPGVGARRIPPWTTPPDGSARVGPVADETIRAQKLDAVARLVPGIAHELNNPLAAIVGFAELLRTDPRLPDDMRRQAELLGGETARTRQLVHALLDFLRARPPERHPTSVRALVDAAWPSMPIGLASNLLAVRIEIPDDLPRVEIDRAQIQLVLVNLLQEALDVLASGTTPGQLRIAAEPEGEAVRITISHDKRRCHARAEDRELAWQVSARWSRSTTAPWSASRSGGVGTTLAVAPAAARTRSRPPKPTTTDAPPRAVRVLVLDDEPPIAMLLDNGSACRATSRGRDSARRPSSWSARRRSTPSCATTGWRA